MREILFRGKRLDNGEWVEGGVYHQNADDVKVDSTWIIGGSLGYVGSAYPVDPETVGQYTGLEDMNGTKIFEGDILECWPGLDDHCRGYVKYGEWNCSCCHGVYGWALRKDGDLREPDTSMVIGNIWDNKDLLDVMTEEDGT